MPSRRSTRVLLGILAASSIAGCNGGKAEEGGALAGSREPPRRPLALLPPPGSGRVDRLIAQLQGRVGREPRAPEAWVDLGHAWVRKAREGSDPGLYLNAQDCAEAALELAPGSRRAQLLRGMVLLNDHRFEEARRLAWALDQAEPRDPGALAILSDALLELGRFEEAA